MNLPKLTFCIFIFLTIASTLCTGQNRFDTLRTVKMNAIPDDQSINITIHWEDDPEENIYSLFKKTREDTIWGSPIYVAVDQDTSFVDTDVEEGKLYEYRMLKETGDSLGYAYLFSGINYFPPQRKGDILILIDSVAAIMVDVKLNEYLDILISEGWIPWVERVSVDASVQEIKSLILQYHSTADSLNTVLLMGNIAVPHSGDISPDGHSDHRGGWPADCYYGDVDGVWTDQTVNNISSNYPRLHNVPGDGNFDQDFIPGDIELMVGRLDFSELPVYSLDEYELLERYLQKNIDFRTGVYQPQRRALFNNINAWKEGLGQNGIRNFVPLVSNDNLRYHDHFDAFNNSYLWSYTACSGSMINSNGIGSISTFADNNFQATFTGFFGSYFGDYDFENNYLRTILASGKVLSTAWIGVPNWYFHPMGMGMDLGFCTQLTQNNVDLYYGGFFPQSITINLLGDPTLKAFIVRPPQNLVGIQNEEHIELTWSPSQDSIQGYQVYKKMEGMDYFEVINTMPISDTNFVDSCVVGEVAIQYLVKAVKQEITPSGSFINHSNGPIVTMQTTPNILPETDFVLSWENGILTGENLSTNADQFEWQLPDGTMVFDENFEIPYPQSGEVTVTLIAANTCFSDTLEQVFVITDLENLAFHPKIKLYPNPAQDFITIETQVSINEIYLYDVLGIRLFSKSNLGLGKNIIDVQNFEKGNYLLKIRVGDQVFSKMVFVGGL